MSHFPGKHCLLAMAVAVSMPVTAQEESDNKKQVGGPLVFDQVVVTATKTENSLATAPASMSVITSDEIKSQPTMALNDIVKQAVGVESRKEGGRAGRESISIRGMDSDYTLIMVNGRKMSSSNAIARGNDFDLSAIPQDNIERIEIIRGPMSALYGSEALGGVVNIITKLPDNEWRSTISSDIAQPEGGNGGTETIVGLNTGGALIDDKLYLNLSVNQSDRDKWKPYSGTRSTVTALEERDTLSLASNVNWLINDNQTLDIDITHSNDKRDGIIESTKGLTPTNQKVKRNSIALTHGGDWSWGESQARYYREEVEIGEQDFTLNRRDYVTETNDVVDGSVSTDFGSHRLTVGGEVRKTELDNTRDLQTTGKADVTQKALFAQDEWQLADDLTLTYGTRIDHHENFGTEYPPRAYLVHSVTDNLTLKGGIGKAFKAPSLLQLNKDYRLSSCKGGCWIIGNPDLEPETSTSYEMAANYQQNNWEVEAAVFQNDVENLIARDFDYQLDVEDGREVYTYKNVEKAKIKGIELGGRMALTQSLSLNGDYTYTDARDETTGDILTDRSRQNVSAKLNWQASQKLSTFVRASYIGDQKLSDEVDLDGYSLVDLGMNYQMTESLRLRAGVTNVTDESLPHEATVMGYSEDPRTWYVGFTTTF
ncbi:siderophore amonabactin TonB-dependent receptor [Kistimonas scapharcae]|uniref:Siderophore amonabactin TonB-dependent receptor n=1 Tax=Kistimonas scapharcae TaxID=1036133 RepID=A0ABP8V7M8_9GAMM